MNPTLTTLEHLSYVLECIVADYMGEAKTELERLSRAVAEDPKYALPNKDQVAPELAEASKLYNSGRSREGASILSRVSRRLWKQVLSEGQ